MTGHSLQLAAGQMLCIADGRRMRISVHQGKGVITQEKEPDDAVLSPGSVFTVQRDGKTILMARTEMLVTLEAQRARDVALKAYVGSRPVVLRKMGCMVPEKARRCAWTSFLRASAPMTRLIATAVLVLACAGCASGRPIADERVQLVAYRAP